MQAGDNAVIGCRAQACGVGTNGAGIRVSGTTPNSSNLVTDNHLSGNWRNLDVLTDTNVILRNVAAFEQGGGNFSMVAGNTIGPVVVAGQQNLANVANANHPQVNIAY
ncbi:MAG: hypothetical protein QM783_02075 [Phycisphaerales bacterium]